MPTHSAKKKKPQNPNKKTTPKQPKPQKKKNHRTRSSWTQHPKRVRPPHHRTPRDGGIAAIRVWERRHTIHMKKVTRGGGLLHRSCITHQRRESTRCHTRFDLAPFVHRSIPSV